jgi:hypothetical protein
LDFRANQHFHLLRHQEGVVEAREVPPVPRPHVELRPEQLVVLAVLGEVCRALFLLGQALGVLDVHELDVARGLHRGVEALDKRAQLFVLAAAQRLPGGLEVLDEAQVVAEHVGVVEVQLGHAALGQRLLLGAARPADAQARHEGGVHAL